MHDADILVLKLVSFDGEHVADLRLVLVEPDAGEELVGLRASWQARNVDVDARNFFEALRLLRLELEADRLFVHCYGASIDVHPSGMSRSMGYGERAYRLQMGRRPSMEDLVYIFDVPASLAPGTVAEQEAFYAAWAASI